jgi:hypothetical protein
MFVHPTTIIIGAGASVDFGFPTGPKLKENITKLLRVTKSHHATGQGVVWTLINNDPVLIGEALERRFGRPPSLINKVFRKVFSLDKGASKVSDSFVDKFEIYDSIVSGLPRADSIDSYLDTHRNNRAAVLCGKLAIIEILLRYERDSKLYHKKIPWIFEPLRGDIKSSKLDFPQYREDAIKDSWLDPFYKIIFSGVREDDAEDIFRNVKLIIFNYDRCVELTLPISIANFLHVDYNRACELARHIEVIHQHFSI